MILRVAYVLVVKMGKSSCGVFTALFLTLLILNVYPGVTYDILHNQCKRLHHVTWKFLYLYIETKHHLMALQKILITFQQGCTQGIRMAYLVICGAISHHQFHHCLRNRLFRRSSKKTPKLPVTGLYAENSPVTGEFPHKWPVTRKMFPFDDIIMWKLFSHCWPRWIPIIKSQ